MHKASSYGRIVFAAVAFVAACTPSRVPPAHAQPAARPGTDAYLAAPYYSGLVASKRGDRIAWVADDRGEHQVWSAAGPDFAAKIVARWAGDDGRPLSELTVSDDGAKLAFVRGVTEGHPVNPTSDAAGPKAEVWVVDAGGASPPFVVGEGTSPVFRPDGASLDYVAHDALHHAQARPASASAGAGAGAGAEDDVVFHAHGKTSPPVWSPDGSRFAFVSNREDHWLVGVFDVPSRRIAWMAPSVDRDANPVFAPDGKRVAFLRFRGRETPEPLDPEVFDGRLPVSIVVADVATGEGRVVVAEDATGGFAQENAEGPPLAWTSGDRLVFLSERDGWVRLYTAPAEGPGAPAALTPTGCEVTGEGLSPGGTTLVATSNCGDAERRHLTAIALPSGAPRALTQGTGIEWGGVATTSGAVAFVGSSARDVPAVMVLPRGAAAPRRLTPARPMPPFVEPESVSFRAGDGSVVHGQLLLPPEGARAAKMPALVFVHGGPVRQMMPGWHPMSFYHHTYEMNQYLASRGYAVLEVNYRLGVGYGRAYRHVERGGPFGAAEYQDVVAGARYLAARADVDGARVGIWGGSYGGLLTSLALARDSATFHAGVDLCGVHDWSRFLPDDAMRDDAAKQLARASSAASSVATWTSPVLFVHGDDDQNVPFRETVDLVQRLRDAGKAHVETIVFPDEQHGEEVHAKWAVIIGHAADFFDRFLSPAGGARTTP